MTLCAVLVLSSVWLVTGQAKDVDNLVLLPVAADPTVSFRILFNVGSQNDPPGKEGLAALTAEVIARGSTT